MSISYLVVRRLPSGLGSASIVIAYGNKANELLKLWHAIPIPPPTPPPTPAILFELRLLTIYLGIEIKRLIGVKLGKKNYPTLTENFLSKMKTLR